MNCKKCQGVLERVGPAHTKVWFCRMCRIAHDETGSALVENPHILKTHFDALKIARANTSGAAGTPAPVRLAMEAHLIQGLQEAYMSGLKDGLLLALHLDYDDQG